MIQLSINPSEATRPELRISRVEWIRSGEWLESQDIALPMLPARATEVMQLAMDPEVSTGRIASVVSKDQVLATLEEISHIKVRRQNLPAAPGDPRHTGASINLARERLGWEPRVSLREGLDQQWRWFKDALKAPRA